MYLLTETFSIKKSVYSPDFELIILNGLGKIILFFVVVIGDSSNQVYKHSLIFYKLKTAVKVNYSHFLKDYSG